MVKLGKILIVDDDPLLLKSLGTFFERDYELVSAASGMEAIEAFQACGDFDSVILDIRMPGMDGLETAIRIRDIDNEVPIIFYTGYPGDYSEKQIDLEHAPYDYVAKTEDPTRLQRTVKNAVSYHHMKTRCENLMLLAKNEYGMVGKSGTMLQIFRIIEKIASTNIKVMILGPTGSGKELVAKAIHKRSPRADKKMGILHCTHKQPDLVQSELFGHVKGSFTGAVNERTGLFEYANGGTVFLDEVGDLDTATQAKLLRVLESGEIQKIGSPEVKKIDVRLLCATHMDLPLMVSKGIFREDLFYRLKGVTISLPSLKDRREDMPELISYFVENYCAMCGDGIKVFDTGAIDLMIEYDWPGNIRQLRDTIESLIALSHSSLITRNEVAEYLDYTSPFDTLKGSFNERVREMKKLVLIKTLARNDNNVAAAARELSLDRSNLYKLLKDLHIKTN